MKKEFKRKLKIFKRKPTNETYEALLNVMEDLLKYHKKFFIEACKKAGKTKIFYEDVAEIVDIYTDDKDYIKKVRKAFGKKGKTNLICVEE